VWLRCVPVLDPSAFLRLQHLPVSISARCDLLFLFLLLRLQHVPLSLHFLRLRFVPLQEGIRYPRNQAIVRLPNLLVLSNAPLLQSGAPPAEAPTTCRTFSVREMKFKVPDVRVNVCFLSPTRMLLCPIRNCGEKQTPPPPQAIVFLSFMSLGFSFKLFHVRASLRGEDDKYSRSNKACCFQAKHQKGLRSTLPCGW